ncbi:MAG: class II glutamine amidotransferase [Candidatus Syntropharchaeia archaeon]
MKMRCEKEISGCSLAGLMSENGERIGGDVIMESISVMHDRGNGLGGGFAAYGIYPDYRDYYALHLMCNDDKSRENTEKFLEYNFYIECEEKIPTRSVPSIKDPPILMRYFIRPKAERKKEDDFMMSAAMRINSEIEGAYVISSGKNMGAFKAVGFPEEVGVFYRLDEYEGYTWIAHGRFPTNTPGWWGGAHPFTILDWAVVHNGEISSYGINKRYLEMFGYKCTLLTDTEVMAYLFDLLLRRHKIPVEIAAKALASPFWEEIDRMPEEKRKMMSAIRSVYGSALVNGPFAIILGYREGMIGLNDRIKLRPLVAARKGDMLYIASEEAAIREITNPAEVWAPKAGEPVIGRLKEGVY